jgi:glycosyltransferase involved in cell wall biosynthesis
MAVIPDQTRLVSVIMPAFNREATIGAAIRSVLAQSHDLLELIVVDDGSTDGTVSVVESFLEDGRVRLIRSDHGGVSAARNLGLDQARGELVAYLDSDNRWVPWFLSAMLRALADHGTSAGYSAISMRDDLGQLTGYRGGAFDWSSCLQRNYVDLNCFVHERAIIDQVGGFDPGLRRMVDWDLILRVTRDRPVTYAPFVGCDYFDGRGDQRRITVSEPAAFEKLVRSKILSGAPIGSAAFRRELRLSFAIKIAAPETEAQNWGDFHFAQSLAEALERTGHRARVDLREQWNGHELADEDVAIVLRGLIPYVPRPGQIAFLWAISHPDQIGFDEYDRYTRVFAASPSHAALLAHVVAPPVETLLQATDPTRFSPARRANAPAVLFCGNSRGHDREIIEWAKAAGLKPALYGGGWAGRVPPAWVQAETIDNRALGPLYAGTSAVLNDHWPSMRAFGIISNRLFDVAAAGGRAVSDPVPGIATLFGDTVTEVEGPRALATAVDLIARTPEAAATREQRARSIAEEHSFDVRARRLVDASFRTLGLIPPPVAPIDPRLHVHVVARLGRHGPTSSTFIRLIAPLTDPVVADRVRVTISLASEAVPDCDVCIVQRTAFDSVAQVDQLVGRLGAIGATLVTDIDDAFRIIGPDHPEAAFYRPLVAALDRAVAASAETWFSTKKVADAYAAIAHSPFVLPNALDPRLWRDWRMQRPTILSGNRVRMLYMGTYTHDADLERLRPALDRLHDERPGCFDLTLVGVTSETAPAPWLTRLSPPGDAVAYPRFVRWLRSQGPFDVGLAPLADSTFNRAKSDVKLLDYAALGLLPVVEDAPAYRSDPHAGDIAVHAADWFRALLSILDDRDEARRRALRASDHVWRKRAVSGIAPVMLARLEAVCRGARRE